MRFRCINTCRPKINGNGFALVKKGEIIEAPADWKNPHFEPVGKPQVEIKAPVKVDLDDVDNLPVDEEQEPKVEVEESAMQEEQEEAVGQSQEQKSQVSLEDIKDDRDKLKALLDSWKVNYNKNAQTTTLLAIAQQEEAKRAAQVQPQG